VDQLYDRVFEKIGDQISEDARVDVLHLVTPGIICVFKKLYYDETSKLIHRVAQNKIFH